MVFEKMPKKSHFARRGLLRNLTIQLTCVLSINTMVVFFVHYECKSAEKSTFYATAKIEGSGQTVLRRYLLDSQRVLLGLAV